MRILALNCGSSSVKASLFASDERSMDLQITKIGEPDAILDIEGSKRPLGDVTHQQAVTLILAAIGQRSHEAPDAVAHRIVHGGPDFAQPVQIDAAVEAQLQALNDLAPLHNPVGLAGVQAAREALPAIPHIAIFDTAFHATLPAHAREYALPIELSRRLHIRRYGFHGTSHSHVAASVATYLGAPVEDLRIVSCHLGNGASVAAIEGGRSIDTSMGMTPLEGLIMGSRAGDLDPGVLLHLLQSGEYDAGTLDVLLNRSAGLKGLAGSNDMRTIESQAAAGDAASRLAIDAYAYRVRKYIGAYAAALGGVDVIAFTAGIGEHSATLRAQIAERLAYLGVSFDPSANRTAHVTLDRPIAPISTAASRVAMLVVRADEELAMARAATAFLASSRSTASS